MVNNRFVNDINKWLINNNMPTIFIDFGTDFSYETDNCSFQTIIIGTEPIENNYFEQFLYEYGCEYCGIPNSTLAFLHECGHMMTLKYFSNQEIYLISLAKQFDHGETDQEWLNRYWEMPDEFAANMWVVNFINYHIEEVEKLVMILNGVI